MNYIIIVKDLGVTVDFNFEATLPSYGLRV